MSQHDLVIRNGTIVDGSGNAPTVGDARPRKRKRRSKRRLHSVAIVLAALLLAVACAEDPEAAQASEISPAALHAAREAGPAPLVLDVRSPGEYASGHIKGALNIPYDQVAQRITEVVSPNGVVVYCMIGPRARRGEAALLAAGHTKVFHLEGGLAAWQAAGLPVTRPR